MVMTTVRLESGAKKKFDSLCKGFGMSVNTAFTIFVNKVIEENRIPFEIGTVQGSVNKDLTLLDNLSGAWNDGTEASEIADSLRSSRTFGTTRTLIDY
ncbi:MAG: type II toxin-antitoxin system RelB/DinJ family antitoxin [Bacteroidales bacterium]|nr:type II toxin-antitoxin system RelB/DinJ family antitoxin [Bacteroidales bacterium]